MSGLVTQSKEQDIESSPNQSMIRAAHGIRKERRKLIRFATHSQICSQDDVESTNGNLLEKIELEVSSRYVSGDQMEESESVDGVAEQHSLEKKVRGNNLSKTVKQNQQNFGVLSPCKSELGQFTSNKRINLMLKSCFEEDEMNNSNAMNSILCNMTELGEKQKLY